MIFVTISNKQAAQYAHICAQLKQMVNKLSAARKTLEGIANRSFDKSFAKCVYILTSESLQCENEIHAQIGSLGCSVYEDKFANKETNHAGNTINGIDALCAYCEITYLNAYKKLLKDDKLGTSLKSLMQNQLHLFMSSLTQLRLFNDVIASVN